MRVNVCKCVRRKSISFHHFPHPHSLPYTTGPPKSHTHQYVPSPLQKLHQIPISPRNSKKYEKNRARSTSVNLPMEFDDLVLGLGFRSCSGEIKPNKAENFDFPVTTREPSLTLSLSGENYDLFPPAKKVGSDHLTRQESAASCFSSEKREREIGGAGGEEAEIDKVSSRISDEDDEGSTRKKLRLTKNESALLEESFKQHSTLNPAQKQELARNLKLTPRQVEVWFQNRRARTKLKQTEVDCEFLKKYCETLTDENRRLQKELAELKALKSAPPLYMQIPAATLAMCPSCERITGTGAAVGIVPETAAKSSFIVAPKQHFFNPFTNPSAAC